MRKGINYWSFPSGTSNADVIRGAARHGFEGAELCLAEDGDLSTVSTAAQIADLRRLAEDNSVEIASVVSMLQMQYNLVSGEASVRQKAKDATKRQLDVAHELGAGAVLVVPGYVGVDFIPGATPVRYDEAYERALEGVTELSLPAAAANVVIGIENVWNRFLTSPLEMRGFLDAVGSDHVGSYFDIGNALSQGYPEHWVRILGHRIVRVHVKDYRSNPGGLNAFVDLLSGDVDFAAVFAEFDAIGYDGWCSAEVTPYRRLEEQGLANASASMDSILALHKESSTR
jgi:L-ribulose-5-phosphate 3-epimerase